MYKNYYLGYLLKSSHMAIVATWRNATPSILLVFIVVTPNIHGYCHCCQNHSFCIVSIVFHKTVIQCSSGHDYTNRVIMSQTTVFVPRDIIPPRVSHNNLGIAVMVDRLFATPNATRSLLDPVMCTA